MIPRIGGPSPPLAPPPPLSAQYPFSPAAPAVLPVPTLASSPPPSNPPLRPPPTPHAQRPSPSNAPPLSVTLSRCLFRLGRSSFSPARKRVSSLLTGSFGSLVSYTGCEGAWGQVPGSPSDWVHFGCSQRDLCVVLFGLAASG